MLVVLDVVVLGGTAVDSAMGSSSDGVFELEHAAVVTVVAAVMH
jgi:hypothetical protein